MSLTQTNNHSHVEESKENVSVCLCLPTKQHIPHNKTVILRFNQITHTQQPLLLCNVFIVGVKITTLLAILRLFLNIGV